MGYLIPPAGHQPYFLAPRFFVAGNRRPNNGLELIEAPHFILEPVSKDGDRISPSEEKYGKAIT